MLEVRDVTGDVPSSCVFVGNVVGENAAETGRLDAPPGGIRRLPKLNPLAGIVETAAGEWKL